MNGDDAAALNGSGVVGVGVHSHSGSHLFVNSFDVAGDCMSRTCGTECRQPNLGLSCPNKSRSCWKKISRGLIRVGDCCCGDW